MGKAIVAGVFLSRTPTEHVLDWVDHLLRRRDVADVIVRMHSATTSAKLERELAELPGVQLSQRPYGADIERCHLIIAGNSRVHVDALVAGRSTVFAAGLDHEGEDALGFVRGRLVYAATTPEELSLSEVAAFYARPGWPAVLRHYATAWNIAA